MILTGTFDFSHVDMVVVNQKDVYSRRIVGKKKVILWHKEHCPKVFTHEEMIEILRGYCKSKHHRMCPSGNTINVYHLTKAEETKRIAEEKERKQTTTFTGSIPGFAMQDMKPGMLVCRTR